MVGPGSGFLLNSSNESYDCVELLLHCPANDWGDVNLAGKLLLCTRALCAYYMMHFPFPEYSRAYTKFLHQKRVSVRVRVVETFPRLGSVTVSGARASLHVVGTRLHVE